MEGRSNAQLAAVVGFAVGLATASLVIAKRAPKKKNIFDGRPQYKPGQTPPPSSPTFNKTKHVYNPSELASAYNLVISTITPRPIALVSSTSTGGVDNLAPFSYFGAMAHDPPMIAIGFCRKGRDRVQKDSLVNILAQKQFCVNIMSEWYLDAANHSCGAFAPDIDEFDVSGLTKVHDCQVVQAPRVGEAAVSYECVLEYVHPVTNNNDGQPTTEIVLAKIVRIHVDQDVLVPNVDHSKPAVDTTKLRPIGRLGGNIYTGLGDMVDIPRPKV